MSRSVLKLSGDSIDDYATFSDGWSSKALDGIEDADGTSTYTICPPRQRLALRLT